MDQKTKTSAIAACLVTHKEEGNNELFSGYQAVNKKKKTKTNHHHIFVHDPCLRITIQRGVQEMLIVLNGPAFNF